MASCREPFTNHGNDTARYAGNRTRDLNIVRNTDILSAGFLCFILPGNAEQIQRIDIPQTDIFQTLRYLLRGMLRMDHLIDRRNEDLVLLCLLDIVLQVFLVDTQINLYHDGFSFPDSIFRFSSVSGICHDLYVYHSACLTGDSVSGFFKQCNKCFSSGL